MLVFLGIMGSFTTFSTFGYETLALLREGQFIMAASSVSLHIFVGLLAVWSGYTIATFRH
jgi:CrcB protein